MKTVNDVLTSANVPETLLTAPSPVAHAANVDKYSYLNLPPLCRISDLLPVLPIKRSTVWLWVRQGRFPSPARPFGGFCTVWKREEILAWLSKAGA